MAGGIYVNRPFSPNIKCVVFGFAMILFYLLSARFGCSKSSRSGFKPNYLLLPLIFIISYVAMAWYDVMYDCSDKLRSGVSGPVAAFDSIFKHQLRDREYKNSVENQEEIYQKNVYLFHLLFITPLLLYIGVRGYRGEIKDEGVYVILTVVAISSLLYHGLRFFSPRKPCQGLRIANEEGI